MSETMGWGIMQEGWRKGPWTAEEDRMLIEYVKLHGEGRWNNVARVAGLKRNGKSCRLRWVNYLRPDLKRGQITPHEESIIIELHARWGNRWSTIARSLPGRTDNEIKNYWRTHFKKNGKGCLDNSKKSRTRLLKKQQFQQQQCEQKQMDIENVTTLFEETEYRMPMLFQTKQESLYPSAPEDHSFLYSLINGYGNFPEESSEDIIWDGLWNLDDFHGNITNKGIYNPEF